MTDAAYYRHLYKRTYFGEKRWTGEYSDANEHSFRKFRAPLSGKTVHVFPEVSAMSIVN